MDIISIFSSVAGLEELIVFLVFIVLPLEKPCNIRRFRLSNPQTVCTFPCFFPYGLKQGKDFYSPLTTLSSSRAELRFASLVEWA